MKLREISSSEIEAAVRGLFISANTVLGDDMREAICNAAKSERSATARDILGVLRQNYELAERTKLPICQDTGMAVIFLEVGQDVHISGETPFEAAERGVRSAYADGYLRKSVVADPLRRTNTGDNTPPVVYTSIVPGDRIHILAMPKGFGSENMGSVKMFTPSASKDDIIRFAVEAVKRAGGQPCPPVVLGMGIGGTMDYACVLAKRALARKAGERNADPYYADMEAELLEAVNASGVGPQGMGGSTTALSAAIEVYPTHIAGLPVALNLGCHANRHAEVTI